MLLGLVQLLLIESATAIRIVTEMQEFSDFLLIQLIDPCMEFFDKHPSLHVDASLFGSRWYLLLL